mmetsp:Transcript_10401/g.20035  ORF Transcript_10401/g.20035 Transcript_10401/m.20035 type:complete len:235 (-) Transcript_10401:1357-2061(-)
MLALGSDRGVTSSTADRGVAFSIGSHPPCAKVGGREATALSSKQLICSKLRLLPANRSAKKPTSGRRPAASSVSPLFGEILTTDAYPASREGDVVDSSIDSSRSLSAPIAALLNAGEAGTRGKTIRGSAQRGILKLLQWLPPHCKADNVPSLCFACGATVSGIIIDVLSTAFNSCCKNEPLSLVLVHSLSRCSKRSARSVMSRARAGKGDIVRAELILVVVENSLVGGPGVSLV